MRTASIPASILPADLADFSAAVSRNCHIADARHAGEMTMCSYLLEMREFYRWERGLDFGTAPRHAEVSAWLTERETLWQGLAGEDFASLPLDGALHPPFAVDAINRSLVPRGLLYGAGIGRFGKPHFFLASLHELAQRGTAQVFVCDREYARDMTTLPAATQGNAIIVRREALRRWIWEQAEAWDAKRNPGALALALGARAGAEDLAAAVERLVTTETETLILHELGEQAAGRTLGRDWERMLSACRSKRAEVLARAVRDNLADCASTLPGLLEAGATASLHFWFANFKGMRLALFPALRAAYEDWRERGNARALQDGVARGHAHWQQTADRLLQRYTADQGGFEAEFDRLSLDPSELALA